MTGTTPTTIVLASDIELTLALSTLSITSGAEITIRSQGHDVFAITSVRYIDNSPLNNIIEVHQGATLTIENVNIIRAEIWPPNLFRAYYIPGSGIIHNSGTFILNGGIIRQDTHTSSSAVHNTHQGTFIMNEGVLERGGNRTVTNLGEFVMNGGIVTGSGWGVELPQNAHNAAFTMNGGTISGNSTGVSILGGTFNMHGGEISNNSRVGVLNSGTGRFNFYSGTISNNATLERGDESPGVALDSIRGGVINYGTFNMLGGEIHDNGHFGIVLGGHGQFNLDGGWIFNNQLHGGLDIFFTRNFSTGGTINNNIASPSVGAIGTPPPGFGQTPTTQPEQQQARTTTANPTTSTVFVNGQSVAFGAFNIDGNNFFRLRDIAYALNGTSAQFSVGWDAAANAISLEAGRYVPIGGEMEIAAAGAAQAVATTSAITLNGVAIDLRAYNIGGSNFFMLRDLGATLGFEVDWDAGASTILISTP